MGIFRRKHRQVRPEKKTEVIRLPYWHCIPCGATSSTAFCPICGRKREDAIDAARWERFFANAVIVAEAPAICAGECEDEVEEPFAYHTGCCPHTNVDLAMDDWDPAKERLDAGVCAGCGAAVYLEHDEDTVYWEVMS